MRAKRNRREWLVGVSASVGAGLTARARAVDGSKRPAIGYCLNTSTIEGWKLDFIQVVDIAAKAGYQAIEPWIREIDQYMKNGGNLKDLAQRIKDHGLTVASAIGFAEWIVDDAAKRRKARDQLKREMDLVRQLGGQYIAAPPAGAANQPGPELRKIAERYRAILEIGDQTGVTPMVELWGFSKTLSRLGEVAFVALESGHPKACILLDVYHLYKGGSDPDGIRLLNGRALPVLHFNDYPATPPREAINDAQRVYPGDGVAPLKKIVADLRAIGFGGMLSLELFNRDYWAQDPLKVAKTGLKKMKAAVEG